MTRTPHTTTYLCDELKVVFAKCKEEGRAAFIPYLPAGYPNLWETPGLMVAMQAGGADIIQLAVPFTDPVLDDQIVRHAHTVAMNRNGLSMFHVHTVLHTVAAAREGGLVIPVILRIPSFSVHRYGVENLVRDCKYEPVHVNGILVPDAAEATEHEVKMRCEAYGVSFIPHLIPEVTDEGMLSLCRDAATCVYVAAGSWIAGEEQKLDNDLRDVLARTRNSTLWHGPRVVEFGDLEEEETWWVLNRMAEGVVVCRQIVEVLMASHERFREREIQRFCLAVRTCLLRTNERLVRPRGVTPGAPPGIHGGASARARARRPARFPAHVLARAPARVPAQVPPRAPAHVPVARPPGYHLEGPPLYYV